MQSTALNGLATSRKFLAVGAPGQKVNGFRLAGQVFIFQAITDTSPGPFAPIGAGAVLQSPTPVLSGLFGTSVDLSELTKVLAVGEPGAGGNIGAAHVYTCAPAISCTFAKTLVPSGAIVGDQWGRAVASEELTATVDVAFTSLTAGGAAGGAFRHFQGTSATTLVQVNQEEATTAGTGFGTDIDMDRIRANPVSLVIAVGAPLDIDSGFQAGALFFYTTT
jgi:hypothetical protein